MAKPQQAVPQGATNRASERPQEGESAIRAVLEEYGGEYADAIEYTDELEDVLTTIVLVLASADDEDVEYVTERLTALVEAGEGISTEGTASLAKQVGENAEDLVGALELVLELQRKDQLEDLIALAGTASKLEIDEDAVHALNRVLALVGATNRTVVSLGRLGRQGTHAARTSIRTLVGIARTEHGNRTRRDV